MPGMDLFFIYSDLQSVESPLSFEPSKSCI